MLIDFDGVINNPKKDRNALEKISNIIKFMFIDLKIPLITKLMRYRELINYKIEIDNNVLQFMEDLKKEGYPVFIITANPYWKAIRDSIGKDLNIPVISARPLDKLMIAKRLKEITKRDVILIDDGYEIKLYAKLLGSKELISYKNGHNIFIHEGKNIEELRDLIRINKVENSAMKIKT